MQEVRGRWWRREVIIPLLSPMGRRRLSAAGTVVVFQSSVPVAVEDVDGSLGRVEGRWRVAGRGAGPAGGALAGGEAGRTCAARAVGAGVFLLHAFEVAVLAAAAAVAAAAGSGGYVGGEGGG